MQIKTQVCRKCLEFCTPAVTKEWENPTRQLNWCEKSKCVEDSKKY
jgi:hypothetical protein